MKRIGIGIAATLLLLLVFMVARALMVGAPATLVAAPPIAVDSNAVARRLAQAIKFQTVSYSGDIKENEKTQALKAMHSWMEQTYPDFHDAAGPEQFGDSLLFTWNGKNPNLLPVLVMAHMDVAPLTPGTEKDWMHAPFSGDIADGFVWGRGTIDDKGQLVAILEAADMLSASGFQPERTIMFAFGQDQEAGGGKGNAVIAKALAARGLHFAWVLDEGSAIMNEPYPGVHRPIAFVSNAETGYANVVKQSLASDFDDVERAKFAALAPFAPFGDRLMLANLWLMKPFVLRRNGAALGSGATLQKEKVILAAVRAKNSKADAVEREESVSEASPVAAPDSPAFIYISNLIKTNFGVPVVPEIMNGATDSRHYLPIADSVLRFRPVHMDRVDLPRVHGTNERIAVNDLGPMVGFYVRLIQDLR